MTGNVLTVQIERWRVRVHGVVQGVGFRPFVWRLAHSLELSGSVCNDSLGVLIEVQGMRDGLEEFCRRIREQSPPLSIVTDVHSEVISLRDQESTFGIQTSRTQADRQMLVAPDVSVCEDCLSEVTDPANRRYHYPFINCTACGPRYTIIGDLPYDRESTTMSDFTMCPACQKEYHDPSNRRFHAEPNACPECGPSVRYVHPVTKVDRCGDAAIQAVKRLIADGGIVAIKGIGGFHLACDGRNADAVQTLRRRKHRSSKPLAVMVADLETCETFAHASPFEQTLLTSPQRPIVLLPRRRDENAWSDLVTPGLDVVGVMLPYSPLHKLLVEPGAVWVMTSGNLSDEPISRENEEAIERLSPIADAFLLHNRRIETVCDDSVLCAVADQVLPIRRSRGYAPLPITFSTGGPSVLAVGGELKATICLAKEKNSFLSQHLGDMTNQETFLAMQRVADHLLRLYRAEPEMIVADRHPGYLSTAWAETFAEQRGVPLLKVQHHHGHVAALLAEHSAAPDRKMIGVCFDGTGYGTDGAIWGGEWLIADLNGFERYAQLSYVPLPGGDACIRYPARSAWAQLLQAGIKPTDSLPSVDSIPVDQRRLLDQQLQRNFRCVLSSSMGRLFDAVASLCGVCHQADYEGQAAMEAEAVARKVLGKFLLSPPCQNNKDTRPTLRDRLPPHLSPYPVVLIEGSPTQLDTDSLITRIVRDVQLGKPSEEILARFHVSMAEAIATICSKARDDQGLELVGLTGGVFQNVLLTCLARWRLEQEGFEVWTHRLVPPNDGGLALGQAAIGRMHALETLPVETGEE